MNITEIVKQGKSLAFDSQDLWHISAVLKTPNELHGFAQSVQGFSV